jgi:hypothetical protein
MERLTSDEKNNIITKLKSDFNTDEVEFIGSNRFVLRIPYQVKIETGEFTRLYKDRLFDKNCEEILLKNEYNGINGFTYGVAPVSIYSEIKIKDEKFSRVKKFGLIDFDGNELLPCIYDKMKILPEGLVEIQKDGVEKTPNINEIIDLNFNWDE